MADKSPFMYFACHRNQIDKALVNGLISRSFLNYRDDKRGKPLGRKSTRLRRIRNEMAKVLKGHY